MGGGVRPDTSNAWREDAANLPRPRPQVHAWGGVVLHDVISDRFARKAVEKGADGLIAVAAGAGGHAGASDAPLRLSLSARGGTAAFHVSHTHTPRAGGATPLHTES